MSSFVPIAKPQTSTFGGTTGQTNLFGGFGTQNQNQNQPTTSLFGNTQNQQQQQPQQSLFGNLGQTQTQQPATGGGLFGQQQNNQQAPAAGSSLFGNQNQNQATTQPTTGFTGFGGFGASSNTAGNTLGQTTTGFGGFGNAGQNQTQPTAGGFGASTTNTLFGNRQQSQQPTLATTQSSASGVPFTKSTKFNDLPDEAKKVFENIDSLIQGRIQISKDLKNRDLGDEANKTLEQIMTIRQDLRNLASMIQSDAAHTKEISKKTEQSAQDTLIAMRIIEANENPQQGVAHLKSYTNFPIEFFSRATWEMRERLNWCKAAMESIERTLQSATAQTQQTPQAIASTLEAQHSTFIALASKTAQLDAEVQRIKAHYTQIWRQQNGSRRDPFNAIDREGGGEFGIHSLRGK